MKSKHKGALGETLAIAWLLEQGYEVFRNVSQHGPADLGVMSDDGRAAFFDVKTVERYEYGYNSNARCSEPKRKPEQIALGIRLLFVHIPTGVVSESFAVVAAAAGDPFCDRPTVHGPPVVSRDQFRQSFKRHPKKST